MSSSEMQPDGTALELYRSVWPARRVEWNARRQLWEIRQADPYDGSDERLELLFDEDEDGRRVYQPFDHVYVRRRLRERLEWLELGPEKYDERRVAKNRALAGARMKKAHEDTAYFLKHEHRWAPALETAQRVDWAYSSELAAERKPLVPVGVTVTQGN